MAETVKMLVYVMVMFMYASLLVYNLILEILLIENCWKRYLELNNKQLLPFIPFQQHN